MPYKFLRYQNRDESAPRQEEVVVPATNGTRKLIPPLSPSGAARQEHARGAARSSQPNKGASHHPRAGSTVDTQIPESPKNSSMAAAPSGAPPAPLPVVGPQFCAPYVVPLTVAKKAFSLTDGDFTVTDGNGAVVLRVKGALFSIRRRRVLLDAAGQPLLSMQEKVFSMHRRWKVFRGDSTNASDLLFTVKKSSIIQLKTELDVFLSRNTAEQVCDYKIKGSYFDRSCIFYLGDSNTMIAQMNRKFTVSNVLLGKDTFVVTVFPYVDFVFIASLVVILDEIHRERTSD